MAKRKRFQRLVFIVAFILILAPAAIAYAAGYDLTGVGTTITINGAVYEALDPVDFTSPISTFVRLSNNLGGIRGYNTDYRPTQFQENSSLQFTRSALLSEVPQVFESATLYREFLLDINQNTTGGEQYETLDTVEIYQSDYSDLCGYPIDGSGGGHSGCSTDNTATLVYDMDAGEDNFIVLDYNNNPTAGYPDLKLLVPNSFFTQDPNCIFQGTGCTVYIHLYSRFGGDSSPGDPSPILQVAHPNNDGYEDWGVNLPELIWDYVLQPDGSVEISYSIGYDLYFSSQPYSGYTKVDDSGLYTHPNATSSPNYWKFIWPTVGEVDGFGIFPYDLVPGTTG